MVWKYFKKKQRLKPEVLRDGCEELRAVVKLCWEAEAREGGKWHRGVIIHPLEQKVIIIQKDAAT